jgi:hypothetical protein
VSRKVATAILGIGLAASFGFPALGQTCVNTGGGFTAGPGKDGSPSTPLTGIVNAYYSPTASVTAGGTSITLNAARTLDATLDGAYFSGFTSPTSAAGFASLSAGDLVLIVQMQDADITSSNTGTYGSGTGTAGQGFSALNQTGRYEFARVATATPVNAGTGFAASGGTITLSTALTNSYRQANAVAGTSPQRRFQVIKVPQFFNVGIGNSVTCARWDGSTGGVVSIDVRGTCQFTISGTNGVIDVNGRGFRGGAGIRRTGTGTGFTGYTNTDFQSSSNGAVTTGTPLGAHGSKGEGIAGTPRYVTTLQLQAAGTLYGHLTDTGQEGYVGGSYARGAPGNAGGGSTDSDATTASSTGNGLNSGGGGGGNCGAGGTGGNSWNNTQGATTGPDTGGRGGIGLSGQYVSGSNLIRVFLGGGGGAGTVNNGDVATATGVPTAGDNITTTPPTRDGRTSSGAPGGGIVIVRAAVFYGTGTVNANGLNGASAGPDGGGGGGAGGTVVLTATNSVTPNPAITVNARGGNGGNAFLSQTLSATQGVPHGPGAGGGGGAVFLNSVLSSFVTTSVTGGTAGQTTVGANVPGNYGATAGTNGSCNVTNISLTGIPGISSGPECLPPIVTEAHVVDFSAVSYSNGEVGLTWNTGFEADNLGFRVWREVNGKRELVTGNGLVAGSALLAGTTLTAGNRYAWRDGAITRGKAGTTVSYWLEDIDLNGKSSWNGPFELKTSRQPMPESLRNAPLLGRNNPVYGSQTTKSLISGDPMELNRAIAESAAVQTSAKSGKSSAFQQTLAAGPAVKLGVRTTGWQSVSRSALVGAGLNPSAVDANLKMYVNGSEVPIRVSANSVEFYGVAADTLQSGEQTYWLVEGSSAGLRIPTTPFGAGSRLGAVSFASLVERRDRTTYFAALQNGDADNFFGAVVSNTAVDQAVTLKNRDAGASFPAQVAVTLQGVSLNSHRVSVKLNGQTIGEVTYANRDQQTFTTTVAQSQILEGQNTVTLQSADGSDVNLVAAVRISYARSFVADADALSLSGRAGQTLTVRGFSQTPRVFDVTDPANPVEVFVRADGAGTGNVSASFVAPGTAGSNRLLVATTAGRFLTPTVTSNTPSTLSATSNAADFVIITTPELAPALTPLVQLRQSQGLTVKVVDVADVYDEFSFGVKSAQAIKDFLNLASTTWQRPVRYAMFAGDASFDPRDFLGFNQDVIPTKLLGLGSLETASDDWFGDFNDSGLSEIAIGRLPGRSQAEITAMVSKIVAFDQANGQAWQRDAIIVADNNDDGGNFESAADVVEATLPGSFTKTSVKVGQIGGAAARTQLLSALNEGKGFVNYLGHGSVSNWAAENLLTSDDVPNLTSNNRPGIVVGMACLNAFSDLFTQPLGKALIRANGRGPSAVWASSSLTLSPDQEIMNRALIQALYGGTSSVRLGDAVRQAKTTANDPNVRRSFILYGDPVAPVQ